MPIHTGLDFAFAYAALQRLLGGHSARQRVVAEFIRPPRGARILDLACGPATLLSYLPPEVIYVGVDSNPAYIAAATRHYGSRGRFIVAPAIDAPALEGAAGFDLVLGMGFLHHLADDEAAAVVDLAYRRLAPGGHLVTLDCAYHEGQSKLARRLIAADRGSHVRTPEGYSALVASRFPDLKTHLATDLLRVPYSQFIIRARKA
jgi:SAM-dependent methyltransferase